MGSAGLSGHHDEARVPGPGLVIGRSGASFGKVHYCPEDYWPLNTALFATDFVGNEPRFVYYALNTIPFTAFNSGSAQASLNRNFIANIPVAIPPRDEQRRIADVLGALDDKIDRNRRLARLLEQIARTEFQARFVDFVGVENLTDSRLGPIPMGWHVGKLADVADLHKEQVKPADTPDAEFEHFSIPAFDAGNGPAIEPGEAMLSAKVKITGPGCVLVSKLNPATKRVWWPHPRDADAAVCSPEFLVLVPRAGVPTSYLYAVTSSDRPFYEEFLAHVTGTTGSRQRVKPATAMSCRVVVPPNLALGRWDSFARPLYDHAHSLVAECRCLGNLRDTLLPKLISGEIRVPDTADPGEVIEPLVNDAA